MHFSPVGTHRICLLFSKIVFPLGSPRKIPLHFTTDIFMAVGGVSNEKRRSKASFFVDMAVTLSPM